MAKAKFERTKPHCNIGTIGHVDHGKTTMSDSLLAHSGIIAPSAAGKALALDYMKEEQERGITIVQANVTLHYKQGKMIM